MTRSAQEERRALADLLDVVGPDAPTLCAGWTARDLAAHLVVRERRPDAAVGLVVPLLAGYLERVQQALRDAREWPELVDAVRGGPPGPMRFLDEQVNTVEFFVHHEDVRRAPPGWKPRVLGPGLEAALWSRIPLAARVARRRVRPLSLALDAPGHGRLGAGTGEPEVTLTGPPSELVLFLVGRQAVARVDAAGPPEALERLRRAKLGI